jgi:hypothetical protein
VAVPTATSVTMPVVTATSDLALDQRSVVASTAVTGGSWPPVEPAGLVPLNRRLPPQVFLPHVREADVVGHDQCRPRSSVVGVVDINGAEAMRGPVC